MQKTVAEKENYRPDEIAEMLDVSLQTIWRWIRAERLHHIHAGGRLRIPQEEYERVKREGVFPRRQMQRSDKF